MTTTQEITADLLDALQHLKLAHHALVDEQPASAALHIASGAEQLAQVRERLNRFLNLPTQ